MADLVRRQLERNWMFLAAVMIVLGAFEFVICAMVGTVDVERAFNQMIGFAPPLFRAILEQNMPGGSPAGILSFGWNHPVTHALLTAVAIALPTQAIAAEVESGTVELIAAQPISRAEYFAAHGIFGALSLCAVLIAGLLGTSIGQAAYGIDAFGMSRLAGLFANGLLLLAAIYAVTLLFSALGREAGRVALGGVLVAVVSFLVNVVATLWSKAEFLKPYSLHHYYDPRAVLVDGNLALSSVVVLGSIAVLGIGAAFAIFARRDLP